MNYFLQKSSILDVRLGSKYVCYLSLLPIVYKIRSGNYREMKIEININIVKESEKEKQI